MWPYTIEEWEWLSAPRRELAVRVMAMPEQSNPAGRIFGGWLMSLMDTAGLMTATRMAGGDVVTAAVNGLSFDQPVAVGDVVCCYTTRTRAGRTSMTFLIETTALRQGRGAECPVTRADFTFVAVDPEGRPRAIRPRAAQLIEATNDTALPGALGTPWRRPGVAVPPP
jgi:acyl-CoA thioesterase YciA